VSLTQLPEGTGPLGEGDELLLSVVQNTRTGARRATSATLVSKAEDRRELGQVPQTQPTMPNVLQSCLASARVVDAACGERRAGRQGCRPPGAGPGAALIRKTLN